METSWWWWWCREPTAVLTNDWLASSAMINSDSHAERSFQLHHSKSMTVPPLQEMFNRPYVALVFRDNDSVQGSSKYVATLT